MPENNNDTHSRLIEAIAGRKSTESFGYGISTAEPYVKSLLQMESAGLNSGRVASADQLMKEAATRLCVCLPEMEIEKTSGIDDVKNIGAGEIQLPPNSLMAIRHVVTTDRRDRDGDILRTAGAVLDPKAPLLWQHQPFIPIGTVLRTLEHTASKLTVVSVLLDLNSLTTDAAKLIEAGALRISHGFRVLEYEQLTDEDGKELNGFDIQKFEILEASLVSVPSNVDAEIELFSRGKLELSLIHI